MEEPMSYDPVKPYNIKKINEKVARKFGVEEYTLQAKFNDDAMQGARLDDIRDEVHHMFEDVMQEIASQYEEDDRIRLSIDHSEMDRPMTMHLQPRKNLTTENIMNRYVNTICLFISELYILLYTHIYIYTHTGKHPRNQ
jgi:hypothetical protein